MERVPDGVEERLHAFVDGELDGREKARFLDELERDATLRQRGCDLRQLKEYVSCAFDEIPAPADLPPSPRPRLLRLRWPQAVAALALLATGFGLGLITGESRTPAPDTVTTAAAQRQYEHVLLHVTEADPIKFEETLHEAESLLSAGKASGVRVEVIANARGIDLLRADISPFIDRVQAMAGEHDNLRFIACATALARLRRQGETPALIRGAHVTPSAVEHIIDRKQDGWVYIKI